ncbi:MAG: urate hydroxylase PuuD, partial [Pseudomonadota bacterium]
RWGAMATIVTGLILGALNGYIVNALTFGLAEGFVRNHVLIGIGMWLGTIMWFNVWFVIWPNQQKALNIDNKYPDIAPDAKAASARTAMLFSRTNTVLSVPMLFAMVAAQNL